MNNSELLHTRNLSNGLQVCIYDQTRVYFGDYFHVRVKVVCTLASGDNAWKMHCPEDIAPQSVSYIRILEKMGVASADVERVKNSLLQDFESNSLPYMSAYGFPKKMIEKELQTKKLPVRKYQGAGS